MTGTAQRVNNYPIGFYGCRGSALGLLGCLGEGDRSVAVAVIDRALLRSASSPLRLRPLTRTFS